MSSAPLLPKLERKIAALTQTFPKISDDRKSILAELTEYVQNGKKKNESIRLNFICTHNSRRSHISQIWAQAAATFYGTPHVECFSGGTEATAFNPRAAAAMASAGFDISMVKAGANPVYEVRFSDSVPPMTIFSKRFDDPFNPPKDFAAVMTCSHADENCPLIIGAAKRIALTYDDPKEFDGTPFESEKYAERVDEIGAEILFAFSKVKP
ncbi:MAG TPA: protein-tyrosine-phosphatase [Chryseosolibacter sp.]